MVKMLIHPNVITLSGHIVLWTSVSFVCLYRNVQNYYILNCAFIFYTICDFVDGRYARWTKQTSNRGKILDTVGDAFVGPVASYIYSCSLLGLGFHHLDQRDVMANAVLNAIVINGAEISGEQNDWVTVLNVATSCIAIVLEICHISYFDNNIVLILGMMFVVINYPTEKQNRLFWTCACFIEMFSLDEVSILFLTVPSILVCLNISTGCTMLFLVACEIAASLTTSLDVRRLFGCISTSCCLALFLYQLWMDYRYITKKKDDDNKQRLATQPISCDLLSLRPQLPPWPTTHPSAQPGTHLS